MWNIINCVDFYIKSIYKYYTLKLEGLKFELSKARIHEPFTEVVTCEWKQF